MKVLALTDGSVLAASSLDAFDGLLHVDTHVPLAPLPVELHKPDLVVIAFADFPEFGLHPLFMWLERYKLVAKPRVVCLPPEVTKQYSAAVRPFADRVLPLPLSPALMLDTVQRLDSRIPRIRKKGRDETAATAQSTARTLISAFTADEADSQNTVAALDKASDDVCDALDTDGLGMWMDSVAQYHSPTARHSMLVAGLAAQWARLLGVSDKDHRQFTRGALLHDIGKMNVPVSILNKTGPLTEEEETIIRAHPAEGKRILEQVPEPSPLIVELAYCHHEMLDGSGYPRGISGNQIGDMVRCLTIVDAYAGLVDAPAGRKNMTPQEAYARLQTMTEKLDQPLLGAFRAVVDVHGSIQSQAA
ncbi:MAG: HD domain-containing phosphohydrolase [Pseudomonadota bacterium]